MYASQVNSTLVKVVSSAVVFLFMFAFSLLSTEDWTGPDDATSKSRGLAYIIDTCGEDLKADTRGGKARERLKTIETWCHLATKVDFWKGGLHRLDL